MLLAIVGLIDILAGISLLFPNFLGFYLGIILLFKGLTSALGGISSKMFLVLGVIDMIAGLMLVFNFSLPWLWVILIIKGVYSFVIGLGSG
ncbi:MAG: hypothetical protein ABIE55_02920 [Candidatus Aenigmatarchaeota archaeon]